MSLVTAAVFGRCGVVAFVKLIAGGVAGQCRCVVGVLHGTGFITFCLAGVVPPEWTEALTAPAAVSNDVRAPITVGRGGGGTVIT